MRRTLALAALAGLGAGALVASVGLGESTAPAQAGPLACSIPLTLSPPPRDRPRYALNIRIGRGLKEASGTLAVSFEPTVATDRIVFRLWPNSPFYATRSARLTVGSVKAGGRAVATNRPNATTLVVNRALAAGEPVTVSMSWKLRLPRGANFPLKGGGSARLVSFFPILAWDGSGWALDPPLRKSGSFWSTSPTADFDVRIVTPRGLRVLATGSEVRPGHWRAQSVRDFALAVGAFAIRRTTVRLPRPVRVLVGLEGGGYPSQAYVSETTRALRWYAQRYGGYPWPTYTLAVMTDAVAVAYPTIGFLDSSVLIPHETAHQWFYALVGNNQARDPWLSEGTASWAQTGPERSLAAMRAASIPADVQNRLGEPMSFWDSRGFEKLRLGVHVQTVQALADLGDSGTVDCALRQFVVQNAYRTTTPRDLLAALQAFFPDAEQQLSARGARFGP